MFRTDIAIVAGEMLCLYRSAFLAGGSLHKVLRTGLTLMDNVPSTGNERVPRAVATKMRDAAREVGIPTFVGVSMNGRKLLRQTFTNAIRTFCEPTDDFTAINQLTEWSS